AAPLYRPPLTPRAGARHPRAARVLEGVRGGGVPRSPGALRPVVVRVQGAGGGRGAASPVPAGPGLLAGEHRGDPRDRAHHPGEPPRPVPRGCRAGADRDRLIALRTSDPAAPPGPPP